MLLLLLLLPFAGALFAHDGIFVSIKPAPSEAEATIAHRGTDVKLLTDQERKTFQLTKEIMKKAVEIVSHQKPTNVVINEEETDLYKIYKWHEIRRHFELKSIKIANVTTEVAKLSEEVYTNNGNETETVKANTYAGHTSFRARNYWSENVEVSASVRYELVRPGKKPLDYAYNSVVGEDDSSSGIHIVNYDDTTAKFNLNPGQAAKFVLSANTVTTNVKVEYETKLTGDVVVRYADKHRGKEFRAYDVNELLRALNMTAVVETQEFVTISYVKDYSVKLVDIATGKDIPYTDLVTPDSREIEVITNQSFRA